MPTPASDTYRNQRLLIHTLLDAEAADSNNPEPAFRLGYLVGWLAEHITTGQIYDMQRRLEVLRSKTTK